MTATDRSTVSHLVYDLELLLDSLRTLTNPISIADHIQQAIRAVAEPPPGHPSELRDLAAAFRLAGRDAQPLSSEIRRLGTGTLPEIWQGLAGAKAAQVATATADLTERIEPAFTVAASAIEGYADSVERLRKRHADLHQQLYDAWHELSHDLSHPIEIGRHGVTLPGKDLLGDLARLKQRVVDLVTGCWRVYQESLDAADALDGHLADVTGRARAGVNRRAHQSAASAVLLADTAIGGSVNGDNVILTGAQAQRAADLRARLSAPDQARLDAILARATSTEEQAYLLKTFAAGHSLDELDEFGRRIQGREPDWLREHLSLVDPGQPGAARFNGARVEQLDETTCGSTSLVVARSMVDPMYTLQLTLGEPGHENETSDAFTERLRAEEQRVHDSTNTVWPQKLGTTPWGVSGELNDQAATMGTRYDWRVVDDTNDRSVDPALRDAVSAVDQGYPVPVLIGDRYPAHYVLLAGHDGNDLLFYQPGGGEVVRVSEQDFLNGNMSQLGYRHVQAVVAPKS